MNTVEPEAGMKIRNRKTKAEWTVVKVDRHSNGDVSYVRLMNIWSRHRSITLFEWNEVYEVVEKKPKAEG